MIAADDNTSINSNSKTSSDSSQERRTVGEELFLVHLSRASAAEPDPADFDRETKAKAVAAVAAVAAAASAAKKKAKPKSDKPSDDEDLPPTPGEELWKVHCKRFKGSDDDADDDEEEAGGTTPEGAVKGKRGIIGSAAARDDERVLHLRNRDVAIH
jgi:hypothetical protein